MNVNRGAGGSGNTAPPDRAVNAPGSFDSLGSSVFRVLGAVFSLPPTHPAMVEIVRWLEENALEAAWPCCSPIALATIGRRLKQAVSDSTPELLAAEYQALFVGPDTLAAPPWGSVYLGEDQTLFGESTLALQDFLKTHGIEPRFVGNEPVDHIGFVLLLLAALIEQDRASAAQALLRAHLRPWVFAYLERLCLAATRIHSGFYAAWANLARITIEAADSAA